MYLERDRVNWRSEMVEGDGGKEYGDKNGRGQGG